MSALTKWRAAAIQMISSDDVSANLRTAQALIARAVDQGAQFVCLPENFAFFGANLNVTADYDANAIRQHMAMLAERHAIYLQAGSVAVPDADSGKYHASSFLYNPLGKEIARYNKIHLFDAVVNDAQQSYCESKQYAQGDDVVCVATAGFTLGMAICYDLRFPELFQQLRQRGADIITLPSAFTYVTGKKHWEILLRARAIETQCYLIAANQGGQHAGSRRTWGHSMIIDPDGHIMAQAEQGETVLLADIDLQSLQAIRQAMPIWQHKRIF